MLNVTAIFYCLQVKSNLVMIIVDTPTAIQRSTFDDHQTPRSFLQISAIARITLFTDTHTKTCNFFISMNAGI